jgi:hypothetical protein
MESLAVRILGAVGAAILSVTVFASGVASADAVTGHTYSDASAAISSTNGTPVIATVSGDQLVTDNCIVTSWRKSIFLDSSGRNGRSAEWLLNLNCNNRVASPGKPGNSLMTPQGAQGKKDQQDAAKINADPTWCQENDKNLATCRTFCDRTGLCAV